MMNDISLTIGGDAGQGIESSGALLLKALVRSGRHAYSMVDYRSRIRGGHNFYQIRVGDRRFYSHRDPVHILIGMTEETINIHIDNVARDGVVIYDRDFKRVDAGKIEAHGARALPVPLAEIAQRHGSKVMMNTAALGVAAALLGIDKQWLASVLRDQFGEKGDRVADANQTVMEEGYAIGERAAAGFPYRLQGTGPGAGARRIALNGNQALAMGAIAGGCRFMAAYPMTPGTSIFEFLTAHSRSLGIVTKHAEDEIAAVCMVVGAAHAGARAMTSTSGGGFSLMTEALGMAGMVELPIVIVLAQRGGPSTGLPTRTEQGDLLFAIHASQGEFPRIVLAPGTVEQCFEAGWRAFNLAETYQCPVIVLTDQQLASSVTDLPFEQLSLEQVVIDRGWTLTQAQLDALREPYLRFRATDSGISPRALPGHEKAVYPLTTDEHDEEGHISEEIMNRRQQMSKRMRKLEHARRHAMRPPAWYGPEDADVTLICWGSMYGNCREAVNEAQQRGRSVNMLHFSDLWPLPVEQVRAALQRVRTAVCVEQNYTSQLARLLRMETGYDIVHHLNKFDGRPFCPVEMLQRLEEAVGVHV